MSYALTRYTANGSDSSFSVGFDYRDGADVIVKLNGVTQTITTDYTLASGGTLVAFTSTPTNGDVVTIRRSTSQTVRLVDYSSGAVFKESDLDTDSIQGFYMAQEAIDTAEEGITKNDLDQWDAEGKRIINVADPVDNTDAVNKQFISTNLPNITTVAGIAGDVTTVAGIESDVTAVAADAADIGTVAASIGDVNKYANTYFISATAPSSPTEGDLWYDSTNNVMKVYSGSQWDNAGAGSVVNGTSIRVNYTVGTPSGSYLGSHSQFPVSYDVGFVDVYLNGVKLVVGTDFTATDGSTVVLSSVASTGDKVDIVAYGTFTLANIQSTSVFFTQDGTGAVQRSVDSKLNESVSVKDFGAVGDGVTDDTAAIQAAIDATPNGGKIFVPVGNYRLTSTINLNKPALHFIGSGSSYSGVNLVVDHLLGPGIRVSETNCQITDLKVEATSSRTSGAAGSGLTGNYGILYEGAAANSTYITRQVCKRVQVNDQPSHGIVISGHVWYSIFDQLNIINNGGHGVIVDAGETTGRANKDYGGFSTIRYLIAHGNGGHGLAIGTPSTSSVDVALRMKIDNYDGGNNASNSSVRFSAHDSYILGTNHIIEQSAFAGPVGALKLMGDTTELRNTRLVGNLSSGIEINVPPAGGVTDGILIDRLRVNTSAPLNPAINIANTLVRYTVVKQKSSNNITELVTDLGRGTIIRRYLPVGITQVASYDFSKQGGAVGNIALTGRIPTASTITHAWYEVLEAPTSSGSATLSFGVDANDPTGLKTATAIASYTTGYGDLTPDNTAANFTNKTTNPRNIIMTIGTAPLTAGKINIYYTYTSTP